MVFKETRGDSSKYRRGRKCSSKCHGCNYNFKDTVFHAKTKHFKIKLYHLRKSKSVVKLNWFIARPRIKL